DTDPAQSVAMLITCSSRRAWRRTHPGAPASAAAMDIALHTERRVRPWHKRIYQAGIELLPDGAMLALDGVTWLLHAGRLHAWSADGDVESRPRPTAAEVRVLTA